MLTQLERSSVYILLLCNVLQLKVQRLAREGKCKEKGRLAINITSIYISILEGQKIRRNK